MKIPFSILYISYDGLTDPLGRSQIEPYMRALAKKGAGIVLLTFEKKSISSPQEILRLKKELQAIGIKWVNLRYHKNPAVLSTFFDVIMGIIVGMFIVKINGIRIVHARSYVPGFIAVILKSFFSLKFIFDIRGFYVDEYAEAGIWKNGGFLYRILKYLEKIFFRKADFIISLTNAAKDEIKRFPFMWDKNTEIEIIRTCVDLGRFKPFKKPNPELMRKYGLEDKHVLVYSGSLSTWYMPDEMLKFFQVASLCIPRFHFFVLTKERDFFQKKLIGWSRGRKEAITVEDVDYSSMPEYLSLANAGIAFYRDGFSRKACCPTKLGEYLACGFPVIMKVGVGDTGKIIRDEGVGIVVNDFSQQAYEKAACELGDLLKEGEDLKERCVNAAAKYFSLEKGVETYFEVYEDLLR